MKINELITKHYEELHRVVKAKDIQIYNGLTGDDIFQNFIMSKIQLLKHKDLDEEETLKQLKRQLKHELMFSFRKKKEDLLVLNGIFQEV